MIPPALLDRLRQARHVVVLTGAGISAESGVPTFREALTGLWARYDPLELATPEAFARDPELVWNWYAWRRELVGQSRPNAGHEALAGWPARFPRFTLITQNVDGLHQAAGSREVVELHGNLGRVRCSGAGHPVPDWQRLDGAPPACPRCGRLLRPDVVWFGETLPAAALQSASEAAADCDVFFSIGTSSLVYPAAGLVEDALGRRAIVVEINPAETPLTVHATFVLAGPAAGILAELTAHLAEQDG